MSLVFREYNESKDRDQTADVFAEVYRSGDPMPATEEIVEEDESVYVAELDGRIVGAYTVCHMRVGLGPGSNPVRCGGLAAVAVRPEARSRGIGGDMIRWSIERMRDDGYALSHLYAFKENWYRKLGWEVCGRRMKIQCPQHRLPSIVSDLQAREILGIDAWREIEAVYASFSANYSGMNARTDKQWRTVTRGTKNLARVFAIGDPAEAYCVLHLQTQFWDEQHVSEVAWANREGYEGLLAFFRSIASNKTSLTWYEPGDSAFYSQFLDQGVKASFERPIMYRVLDVPAAISALSPSGRGVVSILVVDQAVPANSRIWRVSFCEECVEVSQGDTADIEIDVRHLSQAVLGEPSLAALARHGLIKCSSEAALDAAIQLLTPRNVYCMDFF